MAVTAEGIPIRCWTFPGTTSDQAIMKTIKDDLAGWMLHRVVWVADSGFNSASNCCLSATRWWPLHRRRARPRRLEGSQGGTARAGRYHLVAGNLEAKEVRLGDGARSQRFCVCHNPEVARRVTVGCERTSCTISREGSKVRTPGQSNAATSSSASCARRRRCIAWSAERLTERCASTRARSRPRSASTASSCSASADDTLWPTDLALAYKQLYEVERGWSDLKGSLRLRPVFHYREDRIRAHVQLCWLALLLIRTVEHETGDTWRNVRNELDRMHLVTLETAEGRVAQRSTTTPRQHQIFRALEIAEPARFYDFELPGPVA